MFDIKRILQVNLSSIYFVFAFSFLTIGCQAQSKVEVVPTNNSAIVEPTPIQIKPTSKIKFTSVYTKLDSKTCKSKWKPESDEDEVPYFCDGYKDYKIYINTHGISNFYIGREISENMELWTSLKLPSFLFSGFSQTIEWRLADGEPFACIVRAEYDKQIFNLDEKGWANELGVQNLKGFAPISVSIDASKNKRANEEARERADAGYRKL